MNDLPGHGVGGGAGSKNESQSLASRAHSLRREVGTSRELSRCIDSASSAIHRLPLGNSDGRAWA